MARRNEAAPGDEPPKPKARRVRRRGRASADAAIEPPFPAPETLAAEPSQPAAGNDGGIEGALHALREEVAGLRGDLAARKGRPAARAAAPADDGGIRTTAELLAAALKDVPRADDFQPLADHLYEFARQAPALVASLRALPESVGPLEDGAQALDEVSQVLHATCERFGESLLRLPRAEDYEPLVEPLREFARVAPALAEQLATLMRSVEPLGGAVASLRETAAQLRESRRGSAELAGDARLLAAAERMEGAERAIRDALRSLPRDPAYAQVAGQLKELASVSPSLAEWLREVPRLTMPLGESIASLERAAESLAEGVAALGHATASAQSGREHGEGAARRS